MEAIGLVDNGFMKFIRFVIPAIMFCATGLSHANSAIAGAGIQTCEAWTNARKVQRKQAKDAVAEAMMLSWVQGFLTSKNSNGATILDVPDADVLGVVMDKSCAEAPKEQIFSIADELANVLVRRYSNQKRK